MAVSVSDLTTWRDALVQSRMRGVSQVKNMNGDTVLYRSDAEMAAAIAYAEDLIAKASLPQPVNTIRFLTSKGLDTCRTMFNLGSW